MERCPPLPIHQFQVLSSLKTLRLTQHSSGIVFSLVKAEGCAKNHFPVEQVSIGKWGGSVEKLTQLLSYFSKLSKLDVWSCDKITDLGVGEKKAMATPKPPSSVNKVDDAQIEEHPQRGAEEIATEGMLLLPSQLQELSIWDSPELGLHSNPVPVDDNRQVGRTGGGQGLQGLRSLRSLEISGCPSFLSSCSSTSSFSGFPFPTSLDYLYLRGAVGTGMLLPLSNLTSLTRLTILECEGLRTEGLWSLLSQHHPTLNQLIIRETPNFFAGSEPSVSLPPEQEFPSSSSQLLRTDDVAGVLVAPICTLFSSSLTTLDLWRVKEVKRFTKEQEEALVLLVSLEKIEFTDCHKLQCLPKGLHRLPNLKILVILYCAAIMSLPKDGLPSSLQELRIHGCPAIRFLPKDRLPSSLQELEIGNCPAIQSLPKVNDLPSSLRVLDVSTDNSKELRRQCRKLIGTIPIVKV